MKDHNIILVSGLIIATIFLVVSCLEIRNMKVQPTNLKYEDLINEEEENNETS